MWVQAVGLVVLCLPTFIVSTGCRCVCSLGLQDLPNVWRWSSGRVFPSFCPLSRFALGALLANMGLFRVLRAFLARFVGFVWVYVACGLCVACVALYACGVRRIKGLWRICLRFSSSLSLCLLSFYALRLSSGALSLLSSCCPLALSLWAFWSGCCFFFPYGVVWF